MKKRTGKMISLSLAVAMAMTAAPVTALAVNEPVQKASELTPAQKAGETGTDTTTVDAEAGEGTAWAALAPATTLGETPENDAKAGEVTTVDGLIQAITDANDNDTIIIGNDLEIDKTITVNKAVTITADKGVTITVTGSQYTFELSGGATLDGLEIEKADNTNADIVYIVSDATVKNCKFSGTYDNTTNNNQTTRATLTQAGATNFVIENNEIRNLRQPGYIEGDGQIIGNTVENTRGWVVCATADPTLQNNKFKDNAIDIAIIANGATEDNTNFKNAIDDLSAANNDAYVEHQVLKASATDGVYFVEEGNPNATMDGALKDAKDGDTIKLKTNITVASTGSDANQDPAINITKAITLDGDGHTITPSDNFKSDNSLIGISGAKGNDTTPVVIKNLTLDRKNKDYVKHALNLYESTGVVIENVTAKNLKGYGLVVNSSEATVKSMDVSGCGWGAVNVDTKTDEDSELVIEDGIFNAPSTKGSVWVEHSRRNDDSLSAGTSSVEIKGGTFQKPVGSAADDATFNISGGDFQAATAGKAKSFNVTGGTFAQDFTVEAEKLAINGGTFNGNVTNSREGATTITGGNFSTDVSDFVAPGYKLDGNGNVVKKSSGGSSHRYDGYITVINPKNGDVSVSDTLADEGDKITLTITPDKGYVVDKIEIVDLEGDKIDAKKVDDEDGKYTFRMENCDVTVTVTFKEEGKTTEDTDKEEDKDEETTETTELNFTDVKESDWFFKGVEYVVDKGIMSGVSENEFAPSGKLTRAMLVQMLYNMESRPACDAENAFMDVPVGQWYTDAVIWANDAKIVSGMGEGLFAPNMEITREQMVAMLYNYAKYKGYDVTASADLSKFADTASVSAWAQPAMQWAVAEGYISGMGDSQLAPQGTATRAEIASVIMRFMEATAETAE